MGYQITNNMYCGAQEDKIFAVLRYRHTPMESRVLQVLATMNNEGTKAAHTVKSTAVMAQRDHRHVI